jgi:hypothetical protein
MGQSEQIGLPALSLKRLCFYRFYIIGFLKDNLRKCSIVLKSLRKTGRGEVVEHLTQLTSVRH